jgi:colanic acid/amylovoran biosynthesis glycosyltransferase
VPELRPLRIGLMLDQFPELSETFVAGEARELVRLGHPVLVESAGRARSPDLDSASGLPVTYRCEDSRLRRLADMAWLVALHPLGCLVDLWRRRRWRREERVVPLRQLAPQARRIAAFGADHVHAHFAAGAALDALRVGALLGLPYSVMTHGYDIFQLPRNIREKHERAAFAVSACDYSVAYLRDLLGSPAAERLERLVTGVDGQRFQRRAEYPLGPARVLAVGRLVEKKGFGRLIDAAALLRDFPGLERVTIVGDGALRERLEEQVRSLRLESLVELAGPRRPDEVRALLEGAALLVAPCVIAADGDRDTMPVVVKEALAMEVPVVASKEVGLPEVVRSEWGRLVPPGDSEALAGAIRELLELSPAVRAEMGRAGRAFVIEECSLRGESLRLAAMIETAQSSSERLRKLP